MDDGSIDFTQSNAEKPLCIIARETEKNANKYVAEKRIFTL